MRPSPEDAQTVGRAWLGANHRVRRLAAIVAAASVVFAVSAETAFATRYSVTFHGTRQQVRSACAKIGQTPTEGANYTACGGNGSTVNCDNKGVCTGTYTAITLNNNPSWRPSSVTELLQH